MKLVNWLDMFLTVKFSDDVIIVDHEKKEQYRGNIKQKAVYKYLAELEVAEIYIREDGLGIILEKEPLKVTTTEQKYNSEKMCHPLTIEINRTGTLAEVITAIVEEYPYMWATFKIVNVSNGGSVLEFYCAAGHFKANERSHPDYEVYQYIKHRKVLKIEGRKGENKLQTDEKTFIIEV